MRRLALSAFAACGLGLLTACGSSGGYGFSGTSGNNSIDYVVFTGNSAQTNDFFVTPGGTAPLQINAVGQKGTGPAAVNVPDAAFTWAGRFVNPATDPPSVASYTVGPSPSAAKPCPTQRAGTGGTPAVPIYQQTPSNVGPQATVQGFSVLPAGQPARTVYVAAVPGVTPPYCLVIVATHVGDGVVGTKTVLVTSGVP